jgi:hypothetical protein
MTRNAFAVIAAVLATLAAPRFLSAQSRPESPVPTVRDTLAAVPAPTLRLPARHRGAEVAAGVTEGAVSGAVGGAVLARVAPHCAAGESPARAALHGAVLGAAGGGLRALLGLRRAPAPVRTRPDAGGVAPSRGTLPEPKSQIPFGEGECLSGGARPEFR